MPPAKKPRDQAGRPQQRQRSGGQTEGAQQRRPQQRQRKSPQTRQQSLTVAVTGPTGTFGFGLVPLLQSEKRVKKIVGIARRPFDPAEHGWTKMEYRQGDVRDPDALEEAFRDADVVVHLAFMITGNAPKATIRAINVEG